MKNYIANGLKIAPFRQLVMQCVFILAAKFRAVALQKNL